jgi:hypothetical protein
MQRLQADPHPLLFAVVPHFNAFNQIGTWTAFDLVK